MLSKAYILSRGSVERNIVVANIRDGRLIDDDAMKLFLKAAMDLTGHMLVLAMVNSGMTAPLGGLFFI